MADLLLDRCTLAAGHSFVEGGAWSGKDRPVIVDGRNMVDPDACISAGFVYRGIGRGDRNRHPLA